VGPSIELTSCLLPDVTVGLAQQTPFMEWDLPSNSPLAFYQM
jgi:hypothetical protein